MTTYIHKTYRTLPAAIEGAAKEYHKIEDERATFKLIVKISTLVLEATRQRGHKTKRTPEIREYAFSVQRGADGKNVLLFTKNVKSDAMKKVVEGLFYKNVPIHDLEVLELLRFPKAKLPIICRNLHASELREGVDSMGYIVEKRVEAILTPRKWVNHGDGVSRSVPDMEALSRQIRQRLEAERQQKEMGRIFSRLGQMKIE